MEIHQTNKKTYIFLWLACVIGTWAVMPYLFHLITYPIVFLKLLGLLTLQSGIFYGIICYLSYLIIPKTDLCPFKTDNFVKRIIYPGISLGVLIGLIICFFDKFIFSSALSGAHPPFWTGLLASIYGSINEEVLCRLFLFSLIYFLLKKICKFKPSTRNYYLWASNILVALLFGIGHLPMAFSIISLSFIDIFRIIFLNGIAGILFGYLYWSRGLYAAIACHFVADLMLHVFLI